MAGRLAPNCRRGQYTPTHTHSDRRIHYLKGVKCLLLMLQKFFRQSCAFATALESQTHRMIDQLFIGTSLVPALLSLIDGTR